MIHLKRILDATIWKYTKGQMIKLNAIDPLMTSLIQSEQVSWMCHPSNYGKAIGVGEIANKSLHIIKGIYPIREFEMNRIRSTPTIPPDCFERVMLIDAQLRLRGSIMFGADEPDSYSKYLAILKAMVAVRNVLAHSHNVTFLDDGERSFYAFVSQYAAMFMVLNKEKIEKERGKEKDGGKEDWEGDSKRKGKG